MKPSRHSRPAASKSWLLRGALSARRSRRRLHRVHPFLIVHPLDAAAKSARAPSAFRWGRAPVVSPNSRPVVLLCRRVAAQRTHYAPRGCALHGAQHARRGPLEKRTLARLLCAGRKAETSASVGASGSRCDMFAPSPATPVAAPSARVSRCRSPLSGSARADPGHVAPHSGTR